MSPGEQIEHQNKIAGERANQIEITNECCARLIAAETMIKSHTASRERAIAITKIEEAIMWLYADRNKREES